MSAEQDSNHEIEEFVPVVFAHDRNEAESYRALLEDHDIPVKIQYEAEEDLDPELLRDGLAVMVPQEALTEAGEIIERRSDIHDEIIEEFEEDDSDYDDDEDEFADFEELDLESDDFVIYEEEEEEF